MKFIFFVRRYLIGAVILSSITGCSKPFVQSDENFFIDKVNGVEVQSKASIIQSRRSTEFELIGITGDDMFCPFIEIRVIHDNPKTYLEEDELKFFFTNVYLRDEESFLYPISLPSDTDESNHHVRSISLSRQDCKRAEFIHYCKYAQKSESEMKSIEEIGIRTDSRNCVELSAKIDLIGEISVFNSTKLPVRPFVFLSRLKGLNVQSEVKLEDSTNPLWKKITINRIVMESCSVLKRFFRNHECLLEAIDD